ncbi:MAG: bifunctional riboflavin kinase/FAD synthetase, partial [Flavobacteriales bacterium]
MLKRSYTVQVHYDFSKLPTFRKAVVTIGTFDGVHKVHKALLQRIAEVAKREGGESVLLSFYPHPRMVLYPDDHRISLLSSPDEKIAQLENAGLDHLVVYPFSPELSRLSAFEYVRDFLVKGINAHIVVVGHDHRFGRNREGDFNTLLELADVFGFQVEEIPAFEIDEMEVSSTKIRHALEKGDVESAAAFLGRSYSMLGVVIRNRQLGRTIGFPTANLRLDFEHKMIPHYGVYVSRIHTSFGIFNGVTNIGVRPTVGSIDKVHIETHIFEFDNNLYDSEVTLELLHKLRD